MSDADKTSWHGRKGSYRNKYGEARKGKWNKRKNFGNNEDRDDKRFPAHGDLKGREIGLFYRNRMRERRAETCNRPLGSILLSDARKQDIRELLSLTTAGSLSFKDQVSYDHVQDSLFKRDFLKIIYGNIETKLSSCATSIKRNKQLDDLFYKEQTLKSTQNLKYMHMVKRREKLPSFKMKDELLEVINENQVIVISGETGCGKTTQVAQFILDDFIEKQKGSLCKIVCTQPRRISAISVAERVAEERGEKLGRSVGYQIRLENKLPRDIGSILYCTTGIVLKRMETDPSLEQVSHLILDEIHERDVMSDFLITLVKKVVTVRKDLKLILMSATLNSEAFSKYYDNCPIINIPGFTFPVEEYFLEDIIELTKFEFILEQKEYKRRYQYFKNKGRNQTEACEFSDFIEPHVRQLEAEKKYSRNVAIQLRNPKSEDKNLHLIFKLLVEICKRDETNGSVLIFLTGFDDISTFHGLIERSGYFPQNKNILIPLHSQMPTVDQKQIFEPAPKGKRKIIISTNIAETSITIDDVVFVIDCGKIKISNFEVETNTQTLKPEWVSLANANQRRGRAGRVKAGVCYHLISRARYMILEQFQKPEILRKRLDDVILTAKILQLGLVEPFFARLMDSPDPKAIAHSLDLLKRIDALDDNEKLTPLGYHLAKLPVGPQTGKMILFGAIFSCLDPILSVAASLDFKDAFQLPLGKEKEADQKRQELSDGVRSDHLLMHRALETFQHVSDQKRFCWEYFLSFSTLRMLQDMKKQFMGYLHEMNFVPDMDSKRYELNVNSRNDALVKAVICAGLLPNVAIVRNKKNRVFIRSLDYTGLHLHPKSILANDRYFESPFVVYFLRLKTLKDFIHDATVVHHLPIVFFGDHFETVTEDKRDMICISGKMKFTCSKSTATVIKELRDRLNWFLEHKISHPGFVDWTNTENEETKILRAITELITSEEYGDIDLDAFDDFDDDH